MRLEIQVLSISIAFLGLIILIIATKKVTRKISLVKKLEPNRRKVVLNIFYFLYYLIFFVIVIIILGIDIEKILVFISSVLAILGVAFFAQWSLLSNLTSSIILFFYHPLKIGDKIRILDNDFNFSGTVKNITAFYVHMITDDNREITIPNSIVTQKGIEYIHSR